MSTSIKVAVDYLDLVFFIHADFTPGVPASGFSGPPENYDPGTGAEWENVYVYFDDPPTDESIDLAGFLSVTRRMNAPYPEETVLDYLLQEAESQLGRDWEEEPPEEY